MEYLAVPLAPTSMSLNMRVRKLNCSFESIEGVGIRPADGRQLSRDLDIAIAHLFAFHGLLSHN